MSAHRTESKQGQDFWNRWTCNRIFFSFIYGTNKHIKNPPKKLLPAFFFFKCRIETVYYFFHRGGDPPPPVETELKIILQVTYYYSIIC